MIDNPPQKRRRRSKKTLRYLIDVYELARWAEGRFQQSCWPKDKIDRKLGKIGRMATTLSFADFCAQVDQLVPNWNKYVKQTMNSIAAAVPHA